MAPFILINILYYSTILGGPHLSQSPWPQAAARGGGAVIPCVYEVMMPAMLTEEFMEIYEKYRHPCIYLEV